VKVKTSVTLSEELLRAISDEVDRRHRSAFIEEASWSLLRARRRAERDRQELAAIAAHADDLNREAHDVLEYQDSP
jgi:metal-responsive CopG/Arc/MetJ family transcriptional regulator